MPEVRCSQAVRLWGRTCRRAPPATCPLQAEHRAATLVDVLLWLPDGALILPSPPICRAEVKEEEEDKDEDTEAKAQGDDAPASDTPKSD